MSSRGVKSAKKLEISVRRTFSEEFKRQKVEMLINKQISIKDLSELYKVSRQSIYQWLYKYSPHHKKGTVQVVQMESEAEKTRALLQKISELERLVGQKQIQLEYLEKMIELASSELKVDIKKNFAIRRSNTSAKKLGKSTSK